MSDPSRLVHAYFAAVTAGDAETVGALFAADAQLIGATGELRGATAIVELYRAGFASGAVTPTPGPLVIDGQRVAVEIEVVVDGRPIALADFFTIDDGLIQRLAIYSLTPSNARAFEGLQG